MEAQNLEARFDIWCPQCVYKDNKETETPCDHCLEHPVNEDSSKPVDYKAP